MQSDETTPASRTPWRALAFGALLLVSLLILYLPAERSGFIWDDETYVENNSTLRDLDGLQRIWTKPRATPQYYPLVHTSFWAEFHLWELNPLGYHIDNVLLHALAAFLLWRVLLRLQISNAWLVALLFAVHPVMVESVAWVTERKNVLSGVLYFAAALAYWRWDPIDQPAKPVRGHWYWYLIAFAFYGAALFSKTVTCTLPAALLLMIWWKRGVITREDILPVVPFLFVGICMGSLTSFLERQHVGATGPEWAFTIFDRCLIAGRALWLYAGKLAWPADLLFIYPRWHLDTGAWWQWLFPVAALGVVATLFFLRNRIGRGPVVAVLFFAGTLFPALGFSNVYPMRFSFVADHFQYLASVGLLVLAVAALTRIRIAPAYLGMGLAAVLAPLTWNQCHIYKDRLTLWRDTLRRNPDCWLAHNNLGLALEGEQHNTEAIAQYRETIRLKPDCTEAHFNLGNTLVKVGETNAAIQELETAVKLRSDFPGAENNLGLLLNQANQPEKAAESFKEIIRLNPQDLAPYINIGRLWNERGRNLDEARTTLNQALILQPENPVILDLLAQISLKQHQPEEALDLMIQAIAHSDRTDPSLFDHLGDAYVALRQTEAARGAWEKSLSLKEDAAVRSKSAALPSP